MPEHSLLAFALATTALLLIPGPNVALIVANSVAHGTRYGLLTVLGTSSAMVVQLALTVVGMATALDVLASWFGWLRWLGVLYLVYLGIKQWRAGAVELTATPPNPKSAQAVFARGFFVSLSNPKTLLFYSAFLPQFVPAGVPAKSSLVALATTFLCLAVSFDSAWAVLAGRARAFLSARAKLRSRATGGLLIGAALGLALARRK